jgi:hypothetical protein
MVAHALTAEINRAVALRQREQYAKRKPAKGQKELQWITIGGTPDGDKKHAGGTPVQITKTGQIVKGPKDLTGHKVDELGKGTREKNEAKANAEHKAETAAKKKPATKKADTKPAEASGSERKSAEVDPQTTPSKHPRDHIRDLLADGKNRDLHEIRAHMRDEHGIDGKHDHDNPQSHPVNAALKDLAEEGAISVHDPRYGAPSFHMNEDQQNEHGKRTDGVEVRLGGRETAEDEGSQTGGVLAESASGDAERESAEVHDGADSDDSGDTGDDGSNAVDGRAAGVREENLTEEGDVSNGDTTKTNAAGVPADGSPDAGIPEDRAESGRPQGSLTGDEGASTAGGAGDGEDGILQPGAEDGQGSEQPADESRAELKKLPPFGWDRVAAMHERLDSGETTADEVRAWHAEMQTPEFREAVEADVKKMTVSELKKRGVRGWYGREKKADLVKQLTDRVLSGEDFNVTDSGISYQMSGNMKEAKANAIAKRLGELTDDHIAAHAEKRAASLAARAERVAEIKQGIEDPKTIEDFQRLERMNRDTPFTSEQLAMYDDLRAKQRREQQQVKAATVEVKSVGDDHGGFDLSKNFHSKRGQDIFTASPKNRVERDQYNEMNSAAKRLGGWYYKAFKGTPGGFHFPDEGARDKFLSAMAGEKVDRSDILAERTEAKFQTAAESLRAKADSIADSAMATMNQERQTNTARRANMASNIEGRASEDVAKAETMKALAERLEAGELQHLAGVRHGTHIDTLSTLLKQAKYTAVRKMPKMRWDEEENLLDAPATKEHIDHAEFPFPKIHRSQVREYAEQLSSVPGLKKIASKLKKSSAEDEPKFASQGNGFQFSGGRILDPQEDTAIFGVPKGKLIRVHITRDRRLRDEFAKHGQSHAYTADKGKTFGLTPEVAASAAARNKSQLDLVDPIDKSKEMITFSDPDDVAALTAVAARLRGSSDRKLRQMAEHLDWTLDEGKRLHAMDIRSTPELRAALREFHSLKANKQQADPVKTAERSLSGRKIDGFFPTPKALARRLVEDADIRPGMSVLEPSAGKGDLMDVLKEIHGDSVSPVGIEPHHDLRNVLGLKGHKLAGDDLLKHTDKYDRIVMNPPFEKSADIEHVKHAHGLLNPGGRLTAIMSAGGGKSRESFDEWLESVGGTSEDLPAWSFSSSDAFRKTGVNTRLVTIDKDAAEKYSMRAMFERAFVVEREQYAKRTMRGQKDLISGEVRSPDRTQKKLRWITLKNDDGGGGTHVQIDGEGQIQKGPQSLTGHKVGELGAATRRENEAKAGIAKPAEKEYPGPQDGFDYTPANVVRAKSALLSGKTIGEWRHDVGRAAANEHIDWDDIRHSEAYGTFTPEDWNDAQRMMGKEVKTAYVTRHDEKRGKVTDISDDLKTATITHPDGTTSNHLLTDLHDLSVNVEDKSKRGTENKKDVDHLAKVAAQTVHDSGRNLHEVLRTDFEIEHPKHRMSIAKAAAKHLESIREAASEAQASEPKQLDDLMAKRKEISDRHIWDNAMSKGNSRPAPPDASELDSQIRDSKEREGRALWQRTQSQVASAMGMPPAKHKAMVKAAIESGKSVLPDVLADYPELKPPAPKPAPAPKPFKPAPVPGAQMGLFGQTNSGQGQLFNVAKPGKRDAKAAAQASMLEQIEDSIKKREAEAVPLKGQREMFSRSLTDEINRAVRVERYELRPATEPAKRKRRRQPDKVTAPKKRQPGDGSAGWQRVGGAPVFVNGDGKITKGCPGLKNEHVSDLIDEPDDSRERREVRQAHAKAEGIDGKQYSASDRRRHETKKAQAAHANAKAAAKQHGVATHEVLKEMPAQHEATSFEDRETEAARKRARQMTGLTAGRQAAIENRYEDYSTFPGFDEASRNFASEYPHLFDSDGDDTPAQVWEFIRKGKQSAESANSESVAGRAAERLASVRKSVAAEIDDALSFGFGGDVPEDDSF